MIFANFNLCSFQSTQQEPSAHIFIENPFCPPLIMGAGPLSEINLLFFQFAGIKLFAANSYMLQFIIYFIYMNLQISVAFLMTTYFSTSTTATGMFLLEHLYFSFKRRLQEQSIYSWYMDMLGAVTGYFYVIGSGFTGEYLFKPFVEDTSVSSLCQNLFLYVLL